MPRNRYATKAHTEARINERTITGKERDGSRAIDRLKVAARAELSNSSSPADWVRSDARFANSVANGTVQTVGTCGLSQPVLDALKRCSAALD
jgi:hypothetical protein